MQTDYDVIIVGGGPTGLSVGSELSKKVKVLVVDRKVAPVGGPPEHLGPMNNFLINRPTETTKTWFVPKDSFFDNKDLLPCRHPYGVVRYLAKTFSGRNRDTDDFDIEWFAKQYPGPDIFESYPYVSEGKVMPYWRELITNSPTGSEVKYGRFYRDHTVEKEKVTVCFLKTLPDKPHARLRSYTCRLLLDCSGVDSGILQDYEIEPNKSYYWSVFGALVRHPEGQIDPDPHGTKRLRIGDYMLWQTFADTNIDKNDSVRRGRPIFEYEVLDERVSFPLILYLRPQKVDKEYMKAEFLDILHNHPETKEFHDVEIEEFKYGWYPSGGITLAACRDRVDFIGDAGSWTTHCGWGMGFILKNYKPYARALLPLILKDRLDKKSLESVLKLKSYQKTQFLLNKLATYFLANASAPQFDKFIELFHTIDPIICEKVFTLTVAPHEIITALRAGARVFTLREVLGIVPRREYWSFIKDFMRLGGELIPAGLYYLIHGEWPVKKRDFCVFGDEGDPGTGTDFRGEKSAAQTAAPPPAAA